MFCATLTLNCHEELHSFVRQPASAAWVLENWPGYHQQKNLNDVTSRTCEMKFPQSVRPSKGSRSPTPVGIAYRPMGEPVPQPAPPNMNVCGILSSCLTWYVTRSSQKCVGNLCHVFADMYVGRHHANCMSGLQVDAYA